MSGSGAKRNLRLDQSITDFDPNRTLTARCGRAIAAGPFVCRGKGRRDAHTFTDGDCRGCGGRLYTQDREQQRNGEWQSVQNDVTDGFCAVFDLAGVEHGRMRFPKGGAPETLMYPMGEDIGEAPEGENWQEGLRLRVKMPGEDFWRTLMSSAIGLWRSLDRLHDDYCKFAKQRPGKVPLVDLIKVVETKGRTTSYAPTFGIIHWVDPDEVLQRPTEDQDEDLGFESGSASGQLGKAKVAARGDMDDEIPW